MGNVYRQDNQRLHELLDRASGPVGSTVLIPDLQRHKGEPETAIAEYRAAIQLKPGYSRAHQNLGRLLADKGDLDSGLLEFREAVRLEPDNPDDHVGLAGTLLAKGKADEAEILWSALFRPA